ncbi:MAG: hypothetical protein U5L95_04930 [Candidatus Saccharibacteria bacterium]|nr:hypothetical protein [Candidatus Saccharibacteria bacterium]
MKKRNYSPITNDRSGFVTLVIALLVLLVAAVIFVFLRIQGAQGL